MVDLSSKFVRITGIKDEKYVEFDFSIGHPELFVELLLPFDMFNTFCKKNQVTILPPGQDMQEEHERLLWRIGEAGRETFKI